MASPLKVMNNRTPTSSMEAPVDSRIQAHQSIRIRRLFMTLGSYAATFMVVIACCATALLPWSFALRFGEFVFVINLTFYIIFIRNWNLRLPDPNLTAEQMFLSILPSLYVMYYLPVPQARGSFLLLALIPLLYGILGLNTRRFLVVAILSFVAYLALLGLIVTFRPDEISPKGDSIQIVALAGAMLQLALLGGYLYELRLKLRDKNRKLNKALATISEMAHRDELTGIYNRRHLMDVLEQETRRCSRGATAFCLCLFDIDHFKQTNDRYGHLAGDQVLREIAQLINSHIRQIDSFGRYGGEEFLMIMPQTALAGAVFKAEQLRQAVAALEFPDIEAHFRVTLSVGVAEYHEGESAPDVLRRADEALYRAKSAGRNQVVRAWGASE